MSNIQAQGDTANFHKCFLCYNAKQACNDEVKPCCLRVRSHLSHYIGEDIHESRIVARIRSRSEEQRTSLAFFADSHYMLECHLTASLEAGGVYQLMSGGSFNLSNQDLVAQLDGMVLNTWAPKILAEELTPDSISLACLGIGYCNMLILTDMQDDSKPPFGRHDLCYILTDFALMRANQIIANAMDSVRRAQYNLNVESRSWVVLWFLYSSIAQKRLKTLGCCKLLDNAELFRYFIETFASFRKELRGCLAADCPKKANWAAPFDSLRRLDKKLQAMEVWTLSVKWVASPTPTPPASNIPYEQPQTPQFSDYSLGNPSADLGLDMSRNSVLNSLYLGATSTDLIAITTPLVIPSIAHVASSAVSASMDRTATLDDFQDFDMGMDPSFGQDKSGIDGPGQDYFGDYDTFS